MNLIDTLHTITVRLNRSGDTAQWYKEDILELMKEFGIEAYGKNKYHNSNNYYGYVYSYDPKDYDKHITDIRSSNWHSDGKVNNFIVYFEIRNAKTDYMYITDMDIRMRDLLIRKIIC